MTHVVLMREKKIPRKHILGVAIIRLPSASETTTAKVLKGLHILRKPCDEHFRNYNECQILV